MSLMMLAMELLQGSRAIASAKRINEVLDTEIDLTDDRAERKTPWYKRAGLNSGEFPSVL